MTGEGGGGAKSYDGEKACSSVNNSILSRGGLEEFRQFNRHALYQGRHVESPLYIPSPIITSRSFSTFVLELFLILNEVLNIERVLTILINNLC
jgi:hypothetical protein